MSYSPGVTISLSRFAEDSNPRYEFFCKPRPESDTLPCPIPVRRVFATLPEHMEPQIEEIKRQDDACARIQFAFRSSRLKAVEQVCRQSTEIKTWLEQLFDLSEGVSQIIWEFSTDCSILNDLPVTLDAVDGKCVLSFSPDLMLEVRRDYAARFALSSCSILARSGRAALQVLHDAMARQPRRPTLMHHAYQLPNDSHTHVYILMRNQTGKMRPTTAMIQAGFQTFL